LALAEKYFGFTELADDLFGGVSFSWHLTLFPFLILTLQLDQFLGVRSPGLNDAYEAAKQELFEVLIVRDVDRFGRPDPEDAYANFRKFTEVGVGVYTTKDGLITSQSQFWNLHIQIALAY
jgi:hypothetical protein